MWDRRSRSSDRSKLFYPLSSDTKERLASSKPDTTSQRPQRPSCHQVYQFLVPETSFLESSDPTLTDGSYKISVSWSHVPGMGLVCPGPPPIECLVGFDDEAVAASGLVSDFLRTRSGDWRNLSTYLDSSHSSLSSMVHQLISHAATPDLAT